MGCTTSKSSKIKESIEKQQQETNKLENSNLKAVAMPIQANPINIPNQILCEDDLLNQIELHIVGRNLKYPEITNEGDLFVKVYEKKGQNEFMGNGETDHLKTNKNPAFEKPINIVYVFNETQIV